MGKELKNSKIGESIKCIIRRRGGYSKIIPYRDWIHIALPPILLWLKVRK